MQLGVPLSEFAPSTQPVSAPISSMSASRFAVFISRMWKRTYAPLKSDPAPSVNIITPRLMRGLAPSSSFRIVLRARSSDSPCLRLASQCCELDAQLALLSMMMRMFGLVAAVAAAPTKRSISSALTRAGGVQVSASASAVVERRRADLRSMAMFFMNSPMLLAGRSGVVGADAHADALRYGHRSAGGCRGGLRLDCPDRVRAQRVARDGAGDTELLLLSGGATEVLGIREDEIGVLDWLHRYACRLRRRGRLGPKQRGGDFG